MADLTIPNSFTNGSPADATKVNENFNDVATAVNNRYNISDDDEDTITFKDGGHDHSGGTSGEPVTDASGLPLAIAGGAKGVIKVVSGNVAILTNNGTEVDVSATITTIFSIFVYYDDGSGDLNTRGYGGAEDLGGGELAYWIKGITANTFTIRNELGHTKTFYYRVIGV